MIFFFKWIYAADMKPDRETLNGSFRETTKKKGNIGGFSYDQSAEYRINHT